MLFKSAKVQKLNKFEVSEEEINDKLKAIQYQPAQPTQEGAMGWTSPFGDGNDMFYLATNGAYLFKLLVEKKNVSGSLLKMEVDKVIAERKAENPDYNPDKDEKNEIKEGIKLKLLPNTQPSFSTIQVYIDTQSNYVVIETTSDKSVEVILNLLESTFSAAFEFEYIQPVKDVADEMKTWIEDLDLPVNFSLGEACKLKDPSTKAIIQYKKHDLDDEKIVDYLQKGMEVTDIAMDWKGDISFSMNPALTVSGIKFHDTYKEQKDESLSGVDEVTDAVEMDANFAVTVSALRDFLPEFIAAFE